MTKKEIIEYLKSIKPIFQKKGIEEIALFGSFAQEDTNIYSDIDIAIKKSRDFIQKQGAYEYFNVINEIKYMLIKKFGKNVDILDLDSQSPFLKDIKKDLIYV
jgi:predicted nucleotidyltransferase